MMYNHELIDLLTGKKEGIVEQINPYGDVYYQDDKGRLLPIDYVTVSEEGDLILTKFEFRKEGQ